MPSTHCLSSGWSVLNKTTNSRSVSIVEALSATITVPILVKSLTFTPRPFAKSVNCAADIRFIAFSYFCTCCALTGGLSISPMRSCVIFFLIRRSRKFAPITLSSGCIMPPHSRPPRPHRPGHAEQSPLSFAPI